MLKCAGLSCTNSLRCEKWQQVNVLSFAVRHLYMISLAACVWPQEDEALMTSEMSLECQTLKDLQQEVN